MKGWVFDWIIYIIYLVFIGAITYVSSDLVLTIIECYF